MDWFKRKQAANTPPPGAPKSPPPPSDVESTEVAAPVAPTAPTAEEIMQAHEEEMKETVAEYTRKLESLAQILFEKSEENDQLVAKFAQQEDDMKVLIDKMVSSEKELETYKDNQVEYKRRLEVLTDCLEDLARENMKLAARGAPASRPDDYEEDRMPTLREVQIGKTKSEMAAESAAKEVPIKPGMRSTGSGSSPTTNHKPSAENTGSPSSRRRETPAPPATIETSSSAPDVNRSSNDSPESDRSKPKDHHVSMRPASGGLVLPSKSKSKPDVRDAPTGKREDTLAPPKPTTPPPSSSTGSSSHSKHGHKRVPSTEIDTFSNMANDPKALMTVLKKYKGQADSLRRDLIRERQKSESLQLSIDIYEEKATSNDKFYRDNLLKESKRRKDAEYIANVLKKRVTELQFLLDEKDDSDHDSDSDGDRRKDEDEDEDD